MKKSLLLIFIVFILIGCMPSLKTLEAPTNIRYLDGNLVFESDPLASSFVIEINGSEYETSNTFYPLLETITYQIRIKAKADGYNPSAYSELITINLTQIPSVPTNLTLSGTTLTWDAMDEAMHYIITINDLLLQSELNTVSIEAYYLNQMTILVQAVYVYGQSEDTEAIIVNRDLPYLYTTTLNYSKQSTFDLDLTLLTHRFIFSTTRTLKNDQGNILTSEQFTSNHVIKSEYLRLLDVGTHHFYIETSFGDYEFIINITNTDRPYMIAGSEIFIAGTIAINLYYEVFGGTITGLSGNDIQSSEYLIDGSTLKIQASYLYRMFENTERETLILSYTLEKGNQIVIGYIFFKRLITQ